ncbi:hypothetical protein GCM10009759_37570 [Kitasatospora saccharophila]|uniref:DUF3040 family protein n=1 Tax=Kitasatospora saccharophila TaxID=407973 RepID=A0ABP5ILM5_9ACTN
MSTPQWPEGREADPVAARERYANDLRKARQDAREALAPAPADAHWGLGTALLLAGAFGALAGPAVGAGIAGFAGALFLAVLLVQFGLGRRGADALRRAYAAAFGWWSYAL